MADNQLLASMPPLTLDAGCTITVEAIDATTGGDVTDVLVSDFTIYGVNDAPGVVDASFDSIYAHEGSEA